MPVNERDTLSPFRLPPEARLTVEGQKKQPLVTKAKEYQRLVAEWRATQHRIGVLKRDHEKAENLHQIAFAKAIREDAPEPSREAVLKVEEDQKATERKLNALLEALLDVEAELVEVYEGSKAALSEQVAKEIDEASADYREAISALQAARWKLAEAVSMKRFLNTFPDEGDWRPGEWGLYKLQSPSGDPYDMGQVVAAFEFDIDVAHGAPITRGPVYLGGKRREPDGPPVVVVGEGPDDPPGRDINFEYAILRSQGS